MPVNVSFYRIRSLHDRHALNILTCDTNEYYMLNIIYIAENAIAWGLFFFVFRAFLPNAKLP